MADDSEQQTVVVFRTEIDAECVLADTRPELFFGLIGAAGTNLKAVRLQLESALRTAGYMAEPVRLSEVVALACGIDEERFPDIRHEEYRIRLMMDAGDIIRGKAESGDALLRFAIPHLRKRREVLSGQEHKPSPATAYIFDSLKHPDEVKALRRTYGDAFFAIAAYSPRHERKRNLMRAIAKSYTSMEDEVFAAAADDLIRIDEHRDGTKLGQDVRNTFPLADFFTSVDDATESHIQRFVRLLFGSPYTTPEADEYWMFHAKAAALRSADLSRQVGAVITDDLHQYIASGCNEVPMAGGGAFWEGMAPERDDRDFREGRDANAVMRHDIVKEIVRGLRDAGLLNVPEGLRFPDGEIDEGITEHLLFGAGRPALDETRVRNLIEFGRIVHAEMSAISEAARRGIAVKGGTLYCTTFPCHMCARHIISTGIRRVVYTEPYPKSLTSKLYATSTSVDSSDGLQHDRVRFEPFRGIAPQLYFRLFTAGRRKDDRGDTVTGDIAKAVPRDVSLSQDRISGEEVYGKKASEIVLESVLEELEKKGKHYGAPGITRPDRARQEGLREAPGMAPGGAAPGDAAHDGGRPRYEATGAAEFGIGRVTDTDEN